MTITLSLNELSAIRQALRRVDARESEIAIDLGSPKTHIYASLEQRLAQEQARELRQDLPAKPLERRLREQRDILRETLIQVQVGLESIMTLSAPEHYNHPPIHDLARECLRLLQQAQ